MRRRIFLALSFVLFGGTLLHISRRSVHGQAVPSNDAGWKTFVNKAGWSIKYPATWQVSSCRSCPDPTDPNVFVSFYNPSTKEVIMIERLVDKPDNQTLEAWLDDIQRTTNLNAAISEQWITVGGKRALKVINRNRDSTTSENIYVVHGAKTFAIRTGRNTPSYAIYLRILSTFRFST